MFFVIYTLGKNSQFYNGILPLPSPVSDISNKNVYESKRNRTKNVKKNINMLRIKIKQVVSEVVRNEVARKAHSATTEEKFDKTCPANTYNTTKTE